MLHAQRLTAEKLGKRLALILPKVLRVHHPLARFTFETIASPDTPIDVFKPYDPGVGELLEWETYWAGQDTHFVLRSEFVIPAGMKNPVLHLPFGNAGDIFTHPEALLYINGKAIASADRYHHRIDLDTALDRDVAHQLVLKGWTGLTGWPIDPNNKSRLFLNPCSVADLDPALRDFVVLAEVALDVATNLPETSAEHHGLLSALDSAFKALDTRDPLDDAFYNSVPAALDSLHQDIAKAGVPIDVTLHGIGHAHMDIAYLWPIAQIRQKNARTYSNVLRLMETHSEFTFSHSQPQLYAWTKEDFPDIFADVRQRIDEGRWEVLGGMWVEPDVNMPCGEALVRQMLLARDYCRDELGTEGTPVLWLPDTFGFPASLPQLMKQAGIEWFVTNKLNWNQYNEMPSSSFWWEGLDGSRVLAQLLTTPRDVQHLPFPTNYKSDLTAHEVLGTWERNTAKHAVKDLMIAYGYGDGGGGPTDDMIRKAEAYTAMPGAPKFKPGTVQDYFEVLEQTADQLPSWRGELYLEGHRGVLTSQGWIKRANREAEGVLHLAEYMAALAGRDTKDLRKAWELLCLNQFHDILTGTSVPVVFEDARRDFERISILLETSLAESGVALAQEMSPNAILVIDSAPLAGERLVSLDGITDDNCVRDSASGEILPMQSDGKQTLVPLPARSGYQQSHLIIENGQAPYPENPVSATAQGDSVILENAFLRVEIGPDGTLRSIYDKQRKRDVLEEGQHGNQLIAYEDRPISWDAWDIDVFINDRPDVIDGQATLTIVEQGPLRASVLVEKQWRNSTLRQHIRLTHASRRIDFDTHVDWHESHMLLTAAFPVAIHAEQATYDIQFGHVTRPTHANTSWDAAKFEVPAQKWADLSEADYGVALINNGRYGYCVRDNVLRLSLIKSPKSPDPTSDQGFHEFSYSLLPHEGDWRADVPREAYLKNCPIRVVHGRGTQSNEFTPLVETLDANIIIETIKPAEDGRGVIVRLYEAHRQRGSAHLKLDSRFTRAERCSLLETDTLEDLPMTDGAITVPIKPHEIITLRLFQAQRAQA